MEGTALPLGAELGPVDGAALTVGPAEDSEDEELGAGLASLSTKMLPVLSPLVISISLEINSTLKWLTPANNNFGGDKAAALVEPLGFNETLTFLDSSVNNFSAKGTVQARQPIINNFGSKYSAEEVAFLWSFLLL